MQSFLKILSGMTNSVDLKKQSDLFAKCHFVLNFGVRNFRPFTKLRKVLHHF